MLQDSKKVVHCLSYFLETFLFSHFFSFFLKKPRRGLCLLSASGNNVYTQDRKAKDLLVIPRLHDRANIEQTSSKRRANME